LLPSATFVVRRPSDEVAILVRALVPPGESSNPYENVFAPVPPFPTASVPVTCDVSESNPVSDENERQALLMA
jgi:hypothetical protein